MPGLAKSPDSARPRLRVQDARRSYLNRARCTDFGILTRALEPIKMALSCEVGNIKAPMVAAWQPTTRRFGLIASHDMIRLHNMRV